MCKQPCASSYELFLYGQQTSIILLRRFIAIRGFRKVRDIGHKNGKRKYVVSHVKTRYDAPNK